MQTNNIMSFSKYPDDHVYYNCLYNNNTNELRPAIFSETRTSPFIMNPSLYHLAIIRFTIPTFSIPLFLWKTVNNDKITPDNNYYAFTFRYNAVQHTEFVQYINWSNNQPPGVYSILNLLVMLNTCLNNAFIFMTANAPGFSALVTTPPYFTYDNSNFTINLCAEVGYLCNSDSPTGIKIYTNYVTHLMFESVPHIRTSSLFNQYKILMVIDKTGNNNITSNCPIGSYPAIPAYEMRSEFNTLQNLSSLKSILITSNTIRTKEEYITTVNSLNTDASALIVTDFEPNKDESARQWMQYDPQIYRYVDLKSNDLMRSVDLNIYWTDNNGNVYPLYIGPSMYFSVKLLFTLKNSIH